MSTTKRQAWALKKCAFGVARLNSLLAQLRAEVAVDRCMFCEEPLPPLKNRPRVMCEADWCLKSYHRVYGQERRKTARVGREGK